MVDPMNLCTKKMYKNFMCHGGTFDVPTWRDKNSMSHRRTIDVLKRTDENGRGSNYVSGQTNEIGISSGRPMDVECALGTSPGRSKMLHRMC